MDVRGYIRVLRVRWRIIVLVTLACLAAAGAVTYTATPAYQASTQVFVSTQGSASSADLLSGNTFSQERVQSYAKIATSPLVLSPVITKLGLQTTAASLAGHISASAPLNTVLIDITVSETVPRDAARIANAVASQLTVAVAQLEQPTNGDSGPVRVTVTQPSQVPTEPSSPKVPLNLALGLLVGLALGIGAGVLRDTLDTSIRGDTDMSAITDVPVIGGIVFDPDAVKQPLVVQANPRGARAEAFRQLRTNLQFLNVAERPRSIVVTSSVPGEGKSTAAANLALTLAAAGSTVALVEGDLRRPRVAEYLGLDSAAGLTNVLIGQAKLDDVLQPWGNGKLAVLACGPHPPNPSELLGSRAMQVVLGELTARFDYVLVDAPPLLPFTDGAVLARHVGATVVVVASGRVKKDQLRHSLDALATVEANVVGLIVNFIPHRGAQAYGYGYRYGYRYADSYAQPRKGAKRGSRRLRVASEAADAPAEPSLDWHDLVEPSERTTSGCREPALVAVDVVESLRAERPGSDSLRTQDSTDNHAPVKSRRSWTGARARH